MADEEKPFISISSDTIKTLGVALTIAMTLFGVIKFSVSKIDEYDGYSARIAKLEAREQTLAALSETDKQYAFQLESHKNDLGAMRAKIDSMAADVIQLRLNYERMKALMEKSK